ncbi:MAG: toll/interleukin-1 receptor domain-containing protein, partial [Phototrophicaceae bacterium]
RIFISYRRNDSRAITGRIYDRLEIAFGMDNVFKDVDDIPPGADFRQVLREAIYECDVMLVIIGSDWASITGPQGRRLDDPDDFVRVEVETGLNRADMVVVPVLVDGAPMPVSDDLPESLRPLVYRNAVVVRHDPDFRRDMDRLIEQLNRVLVSQISSVRTLGPDEPYQMSANQRPRGCNRFVSVLVGLMILLFGCLIGAMIAIDNPLPPETETPGPADEAMGSMIQGADLYYGSEELDTRLSAAATQAAAEEVPYGWTPETALMVVADVPMYIDIHGSLESPANIAGTVEAGEIVYVYSDGGPVYFLDYEYGDLWFLIYNETLDMPGWVSYAALTEAE